MTPIRVLLIAPSLSIVGGQSVQADRLLRLFQDQEQVQVDFQAINPRFSSAFQFVQRIRYLRTVTTELIYLIQLLRRSRHYDVLHVFTAGYWSFALTFLPVLVMRKLFEVRVILNYHDGRAADHFAKFPQAVRWAGYADWIVVPSRYLVDVFARFGLTAQAIFNNVDLSQFTYRERTVLQPRFLHNRGLETHYNVACTLRAFTLIQQRYPEASLIVAHDGPLRAQLEALAAELKLKHVMFLGSVSQKRMRQLYHEADIYLMSPDIDNMPLSVLECHASGLPLVSTDAGGIPYIVENEKTGLLVPLNDHQALAGAAIRLLENPGFGQKLANMGRTQCFSYAGERLREEWLMLYRKLSSQPRV